MKVELRKGSVYCAHGFLSDLKILVPELKKLTIKIRFIADSGYENYDVFDYLEEQGVGFIIAQKQRETVKNAVK